jgi:DNA modification methylase
MPKMAFRNNGVFKENINKEFHSEVWTINPDRNNKHPAPFPIKLVENCILLTTEENDLVLDPFLGSGTSALASKKLNRGYIGIEIDEKYMELSKELLKDK